MLTITSDGKKIGLDERLIDPEYPDEPDSKINTCVENVYKIYTNGSDKKLTQLIFCDMSTPSKGFNVYDDLKAKLAARGIPEAEIEFIHNADTDNKKAALFQSVRDGDVRILIGSTSKMGAGTMCRTDWWHSTIWTAHGNHLTLSSVTAESCGREIQIKVYIYITM